MTSLELHRGDTWTLDLYVEDTPPLGSDEATPFDLGGCRIDLAIAASRSAQPDSTQQYQVPPSGTAEAGLARLLVLPAVTKDFRPGEDVLHARVVRPGAVDFIATTNYLSIRVLPSLFDRDAP